MDRRTALAFGLMAIVIIGFSILQNVLYPTQPNPEAADSLAIVSEVVPEGVLDGSDNQSARESLVPENTVPAQGGNPEQASDSFTNPIAGSTAAGAPSSVAEALMVNTSGPESTFVVTTPLYRVTISSVGGRIVGFETLEHRSFKGGPVQLIPENIPDAGNEALLFRAGEMDLGRAVYRFEPDTGSLEVGPTGPGTLKLVATTATGLEIHKTLTFDPATYGIGQSLALVASQPDLARETLNMLGTPEDFRFGWNQGIAPTERIQKMEEPAMRSLAHVGDELHVKKRTGLKKSLEKVEGRFSGTVHYAGVQNKYFTVFGIVKDPDGAAVEGRISLGGNQESMTQSWTMEVPALRGMQGEVAVSDLDLFIGPATMDLVQGYGHEITKGIDLGIRWIRPLSSLVLTIMNWMHKFIPNYGVIIIIFSILTKLLFYPLSKKQTESMKKMQEIQPKLKAVQEKYKNDKDKLNQATMKMYQEEGVNPLAGCLPLVVQMPVFFALYQGLSHTISLRMQPFVGWINDLSQPDALFQLPFELPLLGGDFNVLPLLMALAMYYQGKVTPSSGGGGQMAAMTTMMPLIMVFIFYSMPSGLVLYWLVNTILQVYQSWQIHRKATQDGGAQTA